MRGLRKGLPCGGIERRESGEGQTGEVSHKFKKRYGTHSITCPVSLNGQKREFDHKRHNLRAVIPHYLAYAVERRTKRHLTHDNVYIQEFPHTLLLSLSLVFTSAANLRNELIVSNIVLVSPLP